MLFAKRLEPPLGGEGVDLATCESRLCADDTAPVHVPTGAGAIGPAGTSCDTGSTGPFCDPSKSHIHFSCRYRATVFHASR